MLVIVGANADQILDAIRIPDFCQVVRNPHWTEGLSSSIRTGVKKMVASEKSPDAVLLMTCDQPLVTGGNLNEIVAAFETNPRALIVASRYEGTMGVLALFDRRLFPELLNLDADKGVKSAILRHAASAVCIDLLTAATDIDTIKEYKALSTTLGITQQLAARTG